MARTFLTTVDLNWIELLKLRLQNLAVEPASPQPGWMFFDTATDSIKIRNAANTAWLSIGAAGALDAEQVQDITGGMVVTNVETGITVTYDDVNGKLDFAVTDSPLLGGQNSAYHLSRVNHTGTQTSATISDFTEAAQDASATLFTTATHSKITATYDDVANTLALAVSGLAPADITGFDTQVRTSRLDQMAVPAADVAMGGFRLTGLAAPTADGDATNKAYVDAARSGLDVKASVRAATTASIANLSNASVTQDGVTLVAGDRLLVKNGASPDGVAAVSDIYNGIYVVGTVTTGTAPLTRATDADSNAEVTSGMFTFVAEGTANDNSGWVLATSDPITLGTTALTFVQFSKAGEIVAGAGLTRTGDTIDVGSGTGMSIGTDTISVARGDANGRVPLRYAVSVGDGAATSITVTHNLNSLDVIVQIYRVIDGVEVECDVTRATVNTVTLGFATAPTASQYRCVVLG